MNLTTTPISTNANRVYLDCIAADPSSTILYAITSGQLTSSSSNNSSPYKIILLKTTKHPTTITNIPSYSSPSNNITWSIVSSSTAPAASLSYGWQTFKTVDCAVNSKGRVHGTVQERAAVESREWERGG
jgi:hypothetical protein